jgi:hypothetical protein
MLPSPRLFGRTGELEILGRLKTELLRHLIAEVPGFGVARVESEMELRFAGLHQLCAPILGWLGSLTEPRHRGLSVAFARVLHRCDRLRPGIAYMTGALWTAKG